MVNVNPDDVASALHLDGTADLPTGYESDIEAAEQMVAQQVAPHTSDGQLVNKCALYVACAFITGTENDNPVRQLERESQSITFDTDAASPEATDYWARAKAFDPTGRLGTSTGGSDGSMFRVL